MAFFLSFNFKFSQTFKNQGQILDLYSFLFLSSGGRSELSVASGHA